MSTQNQYLKFKDGIFPSINRMHQTETYYGVLEGVPDTLINAEELISLQEKAKRMFGLNNVYLIQPIEKIINPEEHVRTDNGKKAYRAFLPKVVCMVELSSTPMKDDDMECSRLGLIWLQDDFAFPIDPEILKQIEHLDWKALSVDEYF